MRTLSSYAAAQSKVADYLQELRKKPRTNPPTAQDIPQDLNEKPIGQLPMECSLSHFSLFIQFAPPVALYNATNAALSESEAS